MQGKWSALKNILTTTEKVVGFLKRNKREEWFDNECAVSVKKRNNVRKKMLQRKTHQTVEEYCRTSKK